MHSDMQMDVKMYCVIHRCCLTGAENVTVLQTCEQILRVSGLQLWPADTANHQVGTCVFLTQPIALDVWSQWVPQAKSFTHLMQSCHQNVLDTRSCNRLQGARRAHLKGDINAREEIRDDALEQFYIGRQELGQVTVPHGPDQHHILGQIWLRAPQAASHDQHRLDGAHAKVVVVLLAQLLAGQLVQLHHLAGKRPGILKACHSIEGQLKVPSLHGA